MTVQGIAVIIAPPIGGLLYKVRQGGSIYGGVSVLSRFLSLMYTRNIDLHRSGEL